MTALDTIKQAVLGVPMDLAKEPSRVGVVNAFAEMQTQLEGAQSGALVFDTRENMLNAVSGVPANAMVWVTSDPNNDYCGIWQNAGNSTISNFVRRTDLPQFIVSALNIGEGTANAIVANTDRALPLQDGRCLIMLPINVTNTASPATVSLNGGAALPIITNSGNNVVVGGLVAGMVVAGYIFAGKFRLLSDQASAAIVAAAEDAADRAEAAAAGISNPVSYAPQTLTAAQQDQAQANIRALITYTSLSALQAATVPLVVSVVEIAERVVGYSGRSKWKRVAVSDPNIPALAKTQDASGAWFQLLPDEHGRYNPIALGARPSFCIETQTLAWFNACAVKPSAPQLRVLDDLYITLKSTIGDRVGNPTVSLYSKLRELYVLRGHSNQSRRLNLIDPTKELVGTGTITYDNLGSNGNGSSSYLTSPTNINALSGVTQNSITMGVFAHSDGVESNDVAGLVGSVATNNGDIFISPKFSGFMRTRCGDVTSTSGTQAQTNSLGFYAISRNASGNYNQYIDDAEPKLISVASVALADSPMNIGRTGTSAGTTWYNGSSVSIAFNGVGMTPEELRLMYRILRDFLVQYDAALSTGGAALVSGDIDSSPFDCHPAFQAAIDLGNVYAPSPIHSIKDVWWIGDEIKVDSNRTFDGSWKAYFRLMASAPAGANCIGNKDKTRGNVNIKILNCRWHWNRVSRGADSTRPGLSCIVLAKCTNSVISGNFCQNSYLHSINVSSTNESYLGELNWKDGTNGSQNDVSPYNIIIANNYCTDFGDDGITTHWINRVLITGNFIWHSKTIASPGSSGIECDDGTRYAVVQNNTIWECDLEDATGISIKGHADAPAGHTATITGNIIRKCSVGFSAHHVSGVEHNGEDIVFSNNVLKDIRQRGVWLNKCKSAVVNGNILHRVSLYIDDSAIRLTEINAGVIISNNTIDDSGLSSFAIFLHNTTVDPVITGNIVRNCISGIYGNCPGATITGNRVVAGTPTGGGTAATGLLVGAQMVNGLAVGNNITGFANNVNGTAPGSAVVANNRVA